MKTVCVLYGFCEGPRVGQKFRAALEEQGYKVIEDPSKADLIIAHSGGCFLIPEKYSAKHIVHIGLPHWPGRTLPASIWLKFKADLRSHHKEGALRFWLHKTFWNLVYFWSMPADFRMLRGRNSGGVWQSGKGATIIRPTRDTICSPDFAQFPFKDRPQFIELPGAHDDLWRRPEPYIAVVQSLYGKRLLATPRSE